MTYVTLKKTAKGRRPVYLDERANDNLLRMLLVVTQELSVARDRTAALETVLARAGLLPEGAVDDFQPDKAWDDKRSATRDDLNERLFRYLKKEFSN